MGFDPAKLQKFLKSKGADAGARTGGKGTVRRKHKAVRKAATHDDKRLKAALSKLNVRDIPAIEEVNLFKDDGHVIHFASPKVQASIAANTYVVSGNAETKKLQDLLPGIINQLGPDNLKDLKKIYASYKPGEAPAGLDAALGGAAAAAAGGDDDDDVPELVENFEEVAAKPAAKQAPAPAAAPKAEAAPAKAAAAPAPKVEAAPAPAAAPAPKVEAKKEEAPKAAEVKAEPKAEAKKGSKKAEAAAPAPKAEAAPAPKAEAAPAPKAEAKKEEAPKAAEVKAEVKASPKVAPKAEPKEQPKKLDTSEPKAEAAPAKAAGGKKEALASPKSGAKKEAPKNIGSPKGKKAAA